MIHCTDLIRALEHYCRGYGDRANIDRLLAMARQNQEDPRVFTWQRDRLDALIVEAQAIKAVASEADLLAGSAVVGSAMPPARPGL